MSIRIKLQGNGKATVKFGRPVDEQVFISIIQKHPEILLRDKIGRVLKPVQRPPQKLTPEMLEQMKRQQPPMPMPQGTLPVQKVEGQPLKIINTRDVEKNESESGK